MKKFHHLVIKIVCLSIFVSIQCKKVVDPVLDIIPDKVEIEDVWFSDMLDYDGDGYCSDGKLFFELSSNKITGVQSFVWLGYKRSVYVDSSTYYKCFVSGDLNVITYKSNIWYIVVNKFSDDLPKDLYDFMLIAKLSSAPDEFEDKEYKDPDLHNIPLESLAEDTIPR